MSTPEEKVVYIGLVTAVPRNANTVLGSAIAAYVNVLAMATDKDDFVRQVGQALDRLSLDLDGLEDCEALSTRLEKFAVERELLDLANESLATGDVKFGTFHSSQNL